MVPDTTNAKVMEVYAMQFNWTARYAGDDNKLGKAHYTLIGGINTLGVDEQDSLSHDDIIVREIHLVKDQPYTFKFRSKDVVLSTSNDNESKLREINNAPPRGAADKPRSFAPGCGSLARGPTPSKDSEKPPFRG